MAIAVVKLKQRNIEAQSESEYRIDRLADWANLPPFIQQYIHAYELLVLQFQAFLE
jgi:hypothetical protein